MSEKGEQPLPPPASGEARVEIEAAGVAYADIVTRRGVYSLQPLPSTPGYDFVGRITELGPDAEGFTVGQRVAAVTIAGSYATQRNVNTRWLVPAPVNIDAAKLVAATLNGLTAWQMLHRLATPAVGESLLVHGAAGAVGSLLLDLARLSGYQAIGTASAAKHDVIRSRGAIPLDYTRDDLVTRVREMSNGGVVAAAHRRAWSQARVGGHR